MTPDEMDRKFEFIVENQAQFASDIQELKASIAALSATTAALQGVADTGLELATKTAEVVAEMVGSQRRTEATVGQLADAQRRTDERIDRVARLVEDLARVLRWHMSDGHGPAPGGTP